MKERIWISNYSLDDIIGGAEILGSQFSRVLGLKYISGRKIGASNMSRYEISELLDDFISRMDIELLMYNSTNCWGNKPRADYSVAVCCEHFAQEGLSLSDNAGFFDMKLEEWEYQKKSIENADKIIVLSDQEKEAFKNSGYSTTIIEPYIDLEIFKPSEKKRKNKTALFVGRKHTRKGYDILLKLQRRFPDYDFIKVVDGSLSQIQLSELYNEASFLIAPSRYESFGYIFAEALACNLPIISSRVGIFNTWQPDKYGIFPERTEYDEFVNAIIEFENRDFEDSRTIAENRFSRERFERDCNEHIGNRR